MRLPEQEEALRQTGRTTRMLERCLTYRGDGGIVLVAGRKLEAAMRLHRRFHELAFNLQVMREYSLPEVFKSVIASTTYHFITEDAVEQVVQNYEEQGIRVRAVEYDNDTDHEWNR